MSARTAFRPAGDELKVMLKTGWSRPVAKNHWAVTSTGPPGLMRQRYW
ncbi:MAG: hypothetical protein ACYC8T_33260 [Myxococcaceae bacterium]